MTDIRQELQEKAKAMGIKLTAQQADQFQTYMELLLEWNEKINLTAITQPEEVVEKHFLDSLTLLSWGKLKQGAKVIDVGPGAEQELEAAGNALDILGAGEPEVLSLTLPGGEERSLVICQKLRFTPKGYPRHGGTILKHPL